MLDRLEMEQARLLFNVALAASGRQMSEKEHAEFVQDLNGHEAPKRPRAPRATPKWLRDRGIQMVPPPETAERR